MLSALTGHELVFFTQNKTLNQLVTLAQIYNYRKFILTSKIWSISTHGWARGQQLQYRSNVSWQSLASRSSRLETRFSILENFENRVSSWVSRISRIENRVSSWETNELVAWVIPREINRTNGPNLIASVINLLFTDPTKKKHVQHSAAHLRSSWSSAGAKFLAFLDLLSSESSLLVSCWFYRKNLVNHFPKWNNCT